MQGLNRDELHFFRGLRKPEKIQDFLNAIPINFERHGGTCMSPRRVLQRKKAHCLEGALFAAAALYVNGEEPLLLDLTSTKKDSDHVIALFKYKNYWGAMSKTNHAVLRYRDPVYKTVRELAMSYFNEYFLNNRKKTLRSFSRLLNLKKFDRRNWITDEKDLWYIVKALDVTPHYPFLPFSPLKLRPVDGIEVKAGNLFEYGP